MEYDVQKEARVWERIQGTQGAQNMKDMQGARCGVLNADEIKRLICDELADACAYRTLASCLPANERGCLLALEKDERCHAKTLGAIYFLLTGCRFCPEKQKAPCVTCLCEELRKRYREELEGAAKYEELARRAGDFAPAISCIADDERRHAGVILCLLQRLL